MQMFDGARVYSAEVGGRPLTFETGILAQQAGGAVTLRYGDTVLLTTATMSKDVRAGMNFFPMTVEFEEKLYAAGRIPGSFFRREGRPSEQAILISRLVDRPLRPLFPKGMRNETQIIITALSSDGENLMDSMAINSASAALAISNIPWNGPVAAVTVGFVEGEFIVNPTADELDRSTLNLVAAGMRDNILMVEAGAYEMPEDIMVEALKLAHESIQPVLDMIDQMRTDVGKEKSEVELFVPAQNTVDAVAQIAEPKVTEVIARDLDKHGRIDSLRAVREAVEAELAPQVESGEMTSQDIGDAFDSVVKSVIRTRILREGVRPDGRSTVEIRSISCQVNRIPRVHGSGLFMRGETHVLTIATLGTPGDAQRLDTLQPTDEKRYMHHYNFPPFSTGEAYPMRGPKRREIGHGALAERALVPVIPDNYPYTLRLVSEAVSSNGSTSMGSVCGSTLALMDAGVPISAPVSGIAMGLVQDQESGAYQVLSDIQGLEDALGDMDFKVAGTEHGITALQMDLKVKGLDFNILTEALSQAKEGRLFILGKMLEVLPEPRADLSEFAPRILTTHIDPEKIGKLIGPGGKVVRGLQDKYGVKIDIDEDGTVYVSGEGTAADNALAEVEHIMEEVEVGRIYTGQVVRVEPYGAFVNIMPGVDGMVHISQLADYRVEKVEDIAKLGDDLTAMVVSVDPSGKVRMSRQAVLEGWTVEEAQAADKGGGGGGGGARRGGGDRRGGGRDRRR